MPVLTPARHDHLIGRPDADVRPAPAVEAVPALDTRTDVAERVSLPAIAAQVGATSAWSLGFTGRGVRVAVLDTGVAPVAALRGVVAAMVDVSPDCADPVARFADGHGHGTHLAGIIAGRDESTGFAGLAPDAEIVSVKVAGADGAVTPSSVVTGIEWVIAHARELGIRVLCLALDTREQSDYRTSVLAAAVERAWAAGIVVVTAAGNDGSTAGGLSLPASDPFVIAVGGVKHTTEGYIAPEWATVGNADRRPDLAAPGAHVVSLRAPGSDADRNHADTGYVDEERFIGSGSSQSAAVVSALAALLIEARPELTPDEVKAALVRSAEPVDVAADVAGAGVVRIDRALGQTVLGSAQHFDRAQSGFVPQAPGAVAYPTWAGSAWAGSAWAGSAWAGSAWAGSAWAGSAWAGSAWAGSAWAGSAWAGSAWAGSAWAGSAWAGSAWAGSAWADSAWAGSAWAGSAWAGSAWAGSAWAGSAWADSAWAGSAWAGSAWAGSAWAGSAWAGSAWAGSAWAGSAWAGSAWAGSAWAGSAWAGSAWAGSAWAGSAWAGSAWAGSAWAGSAWAGSAWAGSAWAGSAWAGSAWAGSAWAGSAWAGSAWAGSAWAGSAWAGSAWAGSAWAGSAWAGSAWAGSAWAGSAWAGSAWAGSAWAGSAWAGSAWAGSAWAGSAWA